MDSDTHLQVLFNQELVINLSIAKKIASILLYLFFFPNVVIYFWDRERQSMNGGGAERDGDTESETG